MILIYHLHNKIKEVISSEHKKIKFDGSDTIALGLQKLAYQFPDKKLVWCCSDYKEYLNPEAINNVFYHKKMMLSYNPNDIIFFDRRIGYVETTPFINVKKNISYPTWQMSSIAGVVHASVLIALKDEQIIEDNFDYFLNSLAKLGMPLGLLCYSEPRLLQSDGIKIISQKANTNTLFRFVKQHYRWHWMFLLLLNLMVYEKRFPIFAFLKSLFYKQKKLSADVFEGIVAESYKKVMVERTIDVIIPTIGRKKYLYDVLQDLRAQTLLPEKVIIVEQNPEEGSQSELDFITNENWPFVIDHVFTHQAGACNARNIALKKITSEWVFFADDDIRIENNFIQKAFNKINSTGAEAVSVNCFQKGEQQKYAAIFQWNSFGSGCSFVLAKRLKNCKFSMGYEFGFGEDGDFGMQLRNQGCDILYLPEPSILHLKAPIGGFRTKPDLAWQSDLIQPKPSPTLMLFMLLHQTKEQILGYKTTLFFKYYKKQKIKNPISYFFSFKKQWNRSVYWGNELKKAE